MNIPFYRLDRLYAMYKDRFDAIGLETLASGQYVDEAVIADFERKLSMLCHRSYAVTVGSCTDALFFALVALGVQVGDKIIVPAVSFVATVTPVLRAGAVPVFADVDAETGLISLSHLEQLVQQHKPKAVIGVDLYGNLPDPQKVKALVETYQIPYIEDAAQSLGSSRGGAVAGSLGTIACLSFDPTKVVHAFGSGGAVLTDDAAIAAKIHKLRYHGKAGQDHFEHGYNSRISTLQAKLLDAQLDVLDEIVSARIKCGQLYAKTLNGKEQIKVLISPNEIYNNHKYVVLAKDRNDLKLFLEKRGIQTMIHYPRPLYSYAMFRDHAYIAEGIVAAQPFCDKVLTLPLHTFMWDEDLNYICGKLQPIK